MLKPLPTDDELANLVREGRRRRRIAGLAIGAGVGLIYGLVSQGINRVVLPGLPFYQPPFGPVLNVLVILFACMLLGLVSAWPHESVLGVVIAGIAGALIVTGVTVAESQLEWKGSPRTIGTSLVFLLPLLLPLSALVVPFVWSLRWAANKQEDAYRSEHWTWSRVLVPLALAIIAGGVAATALYPPEARPVLIRANELVKAGRAASAVNGLPSAFQVEAMAGFIDHARAAYTLEWNRQFDRYGSVIASGVDLQDQSIVVVRFEDDWTFACLFVGAGAEPLCKHVR